MKEIEDDMVPFGFIDDGTDAINQIENAEDPWTIREDNTNRFIWDPDDPVL